MADQARALMNSIQRLLSILRISQKLTQKSMTTANERDDRFQDLAADRGASWITVLTSTQEMALKTTAAATPQQDGLLQPAVVARFQVGQHGGDDQRGFQALAEDDRERRAEREERRDQRPARR